MHLSVVSTQLAPKVSVADVTLPNRFTLTVELLVRQRAEATQCAGNGTENAHRDTLARHPEAWHR